MTKQLRHANVKLQFERRMHPSVTALLSQAFGLTMAEPTVEVVTTSQWLFGFSYCHVESVEACSKSSRSSLKASFYVAYFFFLSSPAAFCSGAKCWKTSACFNKKASRLSALFACSNRSGKVRDAQHHLPNQQVGPRRPNSQPTSPSDASVFCSALSFSNWSFLYLSCAFRRSLSLRAISFVAAEVSSTCDPREIFAGTIREAIRAGELRFLTRIN